MQRQLENTASFLQLPLPQYTLASFCMVVDCQNLQTLSILHCSLDPHSFECCREARRCFYTYSGHDIDGKQSASLTRLATYTHCTVGHLQLLQRINLFFYITVLLEHGEATFAYKGDLLPIYLCISDAG